MRGNRRQYIIQFVIWMVLMASAVFLLPNVSQLIRDKGQTKLPSSANSQVASVIQDHWGRGQNNTRQLVVVFSNGDKALTTAQNADINATINKFKNHQSEYYIKSMTAASDNAAAKKQLVSKDKSTQLVQLLVSKKPTVTKLQDKITAGAKTTGVKTYVTGGDILNNDFSTETEKGIQKTEIIAVIFIFLVLVFVFRSPIVPLISLLGVGVSFIISLSLVMNLVNKFDFPLSNFTQVFMVVVLFGIGTDYNILLFDQFKEELSNGRDPVSATQSAVRVAGKTIIYSGSSVLIGFTTLGLANFSVYRSAVGVAVGVAVLLLVLLTMNPFFMAVLGKRMFWPTKNFAGGSTSKMWHGLAKNSVLHPIISLLVVLAATLPFIFDANQQLNYDTTAELSPDLPSMVGFRTVQKHFSEGTAEPTTLYVKSDKKLNNEASLKEIDRLTRKLQSVNGVKTVASITQPGGSAIEDLYVKNQLGTVTGGIKTAGKGLTKIGNGLDSANSQLKGANVKKGVDGAKKLADGTAKAENGSKQLGAGATKLSSGAAAVAAGNDTLATGAGQLASGAVQLNAGAQKLSSGANAANSGAQQLNSGVNAANTGAQKLNAGLLTYTNGVYTVNSGLNQLNSKTGALSGGVNQLAAGSKKLANGAGTVANGSGQVTNGLGQLSSGTAALPNAVQQLFSGSNQVSNGLGQLNSKTGQLSSGTKQLSTGAGQVAQGTSQLAQGTGRVAQGTQSLSSGLNKLNSQNNQLVNSTTQFSTGVAGLQAGSQKLAAGLSEMNAQLNSGGVSQEQINQIKQLQTGLTQVNAGITKLDQSFSGIQAPDVNSIQSAASSMNDNSKKIGGDYAGLQSAFNGLKGQIDSANKATGSTIDGSAVANAANGKLGDQKLSSQQYSAVVDAVNAQKGSQSKTNIDYGATQNAVNSLGGDLSGLSSAGSNLQKQLQQLSAMSSKLQELQSAKGSLDQLAAGSNKALPGASTALDSLLNGTKTMQNQVQGALTSSNGLIAGANKINDGLGQLNAGSSQLQNGIKRYTDGVSQATTGANTVNNGANSLTTGANSVNTGANKVASGANSLNGQVPLLTSAVSKLFNGASQVSGGMGKLNNATGSLSGNVNKLYNGSKQVTNGANQVASGNTTLNNGLGQMQQQVPVLTNAITLLDNGTNRLAANSGALTSGTGELVAGTGKLASGTGQLAAGTSQLASGTSQLAGATGKAVAGANQLDAGATKLAKGSSTLASGNQTLAGKTNELAAGLTTINNGQQAMYSQLGGLVGQMAKLQDGLATAANGTKKINTGVGSANSYLTGLKNSDAAKEYYVPKNILKGGTYKQAIDNYLSGDDKAAKFTIVLDTNPASKASMAKMDVLRSEVANNIKGTPLAGSTVALGGQTSQTNDTQKTASSDFLRTAAIMLAGILLALMFITRSILQPFYIIGTLLLAYVSSLSLTRLLSGFILHQDHLTWNTPFFSFIMLIALGVDYSIFLMMKYREFDNASATPANRIIRASGVIGAVVLSAALILSGTFAALMPSGVLTLIQVAMAVIIGLIILVVIIPMVIPSLIKLTYPLTDRMEKDNSDENTRSSRH